MHSRLRLCAGFLVLSYAQTGPTLSDNEKAISDQMGHLRSLPDEEWVKAVVRLAVQIQQLPSDQGKQVLISEFGNLVTEGDAGQETLQLVASTMAEVLRNSPNSSIAQALAQLVQYEHVQVSLDNPNYRAAMEKLADSDQRRGNVDFTPSDPEGGAMVIEEVARQGFAGEFLGGLVPTLSQGNAGYGNTLRAVRFARSGDSGHFG